MRRNGARRRLRRGETFARLLGPVPVAGHVAPATQIHPLPGAAAARCGIDDVRLAAIGPAAAGDAAREPATRLKRGPRGAIRR